MTPKLLSLAAFAALIATGCSHDPMLVARQKEAIEQKEQMIAELQTTMDEQGEVIVEQIKMMAEMQEMIDKQRSAMRETSATLQRCTQRM